jgi:hypothetical protein
MVVTIIVIAFSLGLTFLMVQGRTGAPWLITGYISGFIAGFPNSSGLKHYRSWRHRSHPRASCGHTVNSEKEAATVKSRHA